MPKGCLKHRKKVKRANARCISARPELPQPSLPHAFDGGERFVVFLLVLPLPGTSGRRRGEGRETATILRPGPGQGRAGKARGGRGRAMGIPECSRAPPLKEPFVNGWWLLVRHNDAGAVVPLPRARQWVAFSIQGYAAWPFDGSGCFGMQWNSA